MLFKDFYNLYEQDMKARLKQNTWEHKAHVIKSKILPYFGEKPMKDIQARDVLAWQNELLRHRDKNGKPYSETYLKNLHNQLSCIFNHAVRYYDLGANPAAKAGSIGMKNAKEMNFWTKDENMLYEQKDDERIFPISKGYLHHEMNRGVKETGLKRIQIHDLRHSHVSLLIELGFSAVAIADRVGHESIEITYRYAHLFPSKQTEMANKLDGLKKGG